MTKDIVHALANQAKPASPAHQLASFYALGKVPAPMLGVTVDGLGQLSLPVRQKDAKSLLTLAKPAKFGLREKTLLDKQVRDTHEISADQLTVAWNAQALDALLSTMRDSLGLPHNTQLVPHLHNLLVYEPGQFFKTHQDTEKRDGKVASLIVLLPSPHIGGALHIHHGQEQHAFVSENLQETDIQCIAFYSDCKHEVHEVKQGYRVALTYNLVLESSAAASDASDNTHPNPELEAALRAYFSAPAVAHSPTQPSKPVHLVYLLDHSYTEHSLRWQYLKGLGHARAGAFRQAAQKLGLVTHLALAEMHQSWTATGGDDGGHGYGHRRGAPSEPEPDELIDSDMTLSAWMNAQGQNVAYTNLRTRDDQTCMSTELGELDLVDSQYEGYMGNYGETLDYWYVPCRSS